LIEGRQMVPRERIHVRRRTQCSSTSRHLAILNKRSKDQEDSFFKSNIRLLLS
jgi:hypothetical protein